MLFVTPELGPWAKTGGLGEVSHDLPRALASAGVDVRILVPAYPALLDAFSGAAPVAEFSAPGGALAACRLLRAEGPFTAYLLDCPGYYGRPGLYQRPEGGDWPDNHLRYGLLSRIAAILAGGDSPLAWRPHVVHCHDWQAGLTAAFLAHLGGERPACVFTAHNLAYQGIFPPHVLGELGVPWSAFHLDGLEYYGNVSFLKAGLAFADRLTTVSPTYAREIEEPALGFGMHALLRRRAGVLTGISNGIDLRLWDPAHDPHLERAYDRDTLERKVENKLALQRELGLPQSARAPLFGMVSRLAWQKGLDILIEAAPGIAAAGAQIVAHGDGERGMADALRALAERHPLAVAVRAGFDERLNHRIVAGADALLMPSRYEPCGLTQFHGLRYGTLPVAHRTGGLADWIVDANAESLRAGTANGFTFTPLTPANLLAAAERAILAFREERLWRAVQRNAMACDCGWHAAVAAYLGVYRAAAGPKWPRLPDTARGAAIPLPALEQEAARAAAARARRHA